MNDPNGNYLDPISETSDEYPNRCANCERPMHWLAEFPRGLCLLCHASSDAGRAPVTASELTRMWGGVTR